MSHPRNDDDLRALLHETAAGITPQGSYEEIKERTVHENPNRRWVLPSLAAAAAMALVVGGVGWMLRDDGPSTVGPAQEPTGQATALPARQMETTVYFAGDSTHSGGTGRALFAEAHRVDELGSTGVPDVEKAVQLAISGRPTDPDYRSLWPEGITVADVATSGDKITIALDGPVEARPAGMNERDALLAVIAVVRTAQDALGLTSQVEFLGGPDRDVVSPLDTGGSAYGAGDDNTFLGPVQISSPTQGQTVPAGTVTISGRAATFEANVRWELEDADGNTLDEGYTTAAECCTLAPYSFDLDLEPGTYLIVVHDTDESGADRFVNQDTKRFTVE